MILFFPCFSIIFEFVVVNKHLIKDLIDRNIWSNEIKNKIIENKHKSKVLDHSHRLVGNVQQQFRLTKDFLLTSGLEKQLNRIIESYYKNVIQVKPSSIKIDRAWIVRQFAGDFNPPHIHRGNVSGVCYLEVPNSIKYNKEITSEQLEKRKPPFYSNLKNTIKFASIRNDL